MLDEHGLQVARDEDRDETVEAGEPLGSEPVGGDLLAQGGELGVDLGGHRAAAERAAAQRDELPARTAAIRPAPLIAVVLLGHGRHWRPTVLRGLHAHRRFIFVPSAIRDRFLLTLGDALGPLK